MSYDYNTASLNKPSRHTLTPQWPSRDGCDKREIIISTYILYNMQQRRNLKVFKSLKKIKIF